MCAENCQFLKRNDEETRDVCLFEEVALLVLHATKDISINGLMSLVACSASQGMCSRGLTFGFFVVPLVKPPNFNVQTSLSDLS